MKSARPFDGQTSWIWSDEGIHALRPEGATAAYQVRRFRRSFVVADPPDVRLVLHCSADSRYQLFLNGELIGRGPAKGDVFHQFYETYDLSSRLVAGRNTLAALVMDYSMVKPFPPLLGAITSIMTWAGGWLMEGGLETADGQPIETLSTDKQWKVQVDRAYSFHNKNAPFGGFVGLFERVSGEHLPVDWTTPTFDDTAWENALAVYDAYYFGHRRNVINHYGLVPRMIPPMEEGRPENFARAFLPGGAAGGPELSALVEGRAPLRVPPHSEFALILDVGRETTAFPTVQLSGGRGASVRLVYAEALRLPYGSTDAPMLGKPDGGTERISGETTKEKTGWTFDARGAIDGFYDVYEPAGHSHEAYEPFHWRAFRFIEVRVKTAAEPLDLISVTHRFTAYPFEAKATFHCSDPRFETLWAVSWRTFRLCAHETFEDCPYYEQLQYAGDTQLTSLIAMLATGDDRLTRQAITHFDWSRLPEGLSQSRYPSRFAQNIPSWSLHWIFMVAEFYTHTGDREFAGRFLPGIQGVLAWFRRQKNEDGLLSALHYFNATSWTLGWWRATCPGSEEGPTTVINAQYVHALDCAAMIAGVNDEPEAAARFKAEAGSVRDAINRVLWSDEEGLYYDRPAGPELSVYCNAWAIVADVADAAKAARMLERFPADPKLAEVDLFGQYFVFRALSKLRRYHQVAELLQPWHQMAASGLTTWAEEPSFWRSLCHAWSAHPLLECLTEILGVKPLAPGFTKTLIAPQPLGLTWATGSVATPLGAVAVDWKIENQHFRLRVQSPRTMTLSIVSPSGEQCETPGGLFEREFEMTRPVPLSAAPLLPAK